jgi:hypothetical protein
MKSDLAKDNEPVCNEYVTREHHGHYLARNYLDRRVLFRVTLSGAPRMTARSLAGLAGLLLVLAVSLLSADEKPAGKEPSEKVKKHLGEATLKILHGATRVECFRIGGKPAEKAADPAKDIDGYPVVVTGKEQGKEFAAELAALLLEEKSLFGGQARCFFPGVGFRLWKEKESVDVIVCYLCTGLRIVARDPEGKVVKQTGGGFGGNWASWVKLAQQAFPEDAEIKALDSKKSRGPADKKPGL